MERLPDWERLLAAERHAQQLVPGAVLVGGTAAAIHAGHRVSTDGDHVLADLRERFDEVLAALEAAAGWRTERLQGPVLILDQIDGILTGIRQLRRTQPLQTEEINGLRVPTIAEMARIKAWLLATRQTICDYLDTVVLFERLGEASVVAALRTFDEIYRQSPDISAQEVAECLAAAAPVDGADVDLQTYRGLRAPWNDWSHVASATTFGARLFGTDEESSEYRCPLGHRPGLSVLSEVRVAGGSYSGDHVATSTQFVGVRRGLLRPQRLLFISPIVRKILEQEKTRGLRIEVAHLV